MASNSRSTAWGNVKAVSCEVVKVNPSAVGIPREFCRKLSPFELMMVVCSPGSVLNSCKWSWSVRLMVWKGKQISTTLSRLVCLQKSELLIRTVSLRFSESG